MLCLHHNIVILLVFCSFCISAIEQQHSQKHDRRKWRIPIIVNNALNYDQHDQHRSEWNVIDWWQTNIDEDKLAQALSDNANYRNSMTITDFIAQPQPPPPKPPISSSSSPSSSTSSSSPSLSFAVAAHLTASHAKRPFASLEHDLVGDGWVVDDSGDLHIAESIQLKQFHSKFKCANENDGDVRGCWEMMRLNMFTITFNQTTNSIDSCFRFLIFILKVKV